MKKLILFFLTLQISLGVKASELVCRELFSQHAQQSDKLSPYDQAMQDARAKLDTHKTIVFPKQKLFLSFFRKGYFKPTAFEFDNQRFASRVEDYSIALLSAKARNEIFDLKKIAPQTLEESLALFEAITQLDPETSGFHVIKDFLLRASEKDMKEVSKLVRFDSNRSPLELKKAITKMWFLTHSNPENLSYILENDLNEQVVEIISQQTAISVVSHSLAQGMQDFGIENARGTKAFFKRAYDKSEMGIKLASQVGLTALIMHVPIAMPLSSLSYFSTIPEFQFLSRALDHLNPSERSQIMNKDFRSLPPGIAQKLERAALSQVAWKSFLNVVYYSGMSAMLYMMEENLRNWMTNTSTPAQRQSLEVDSLKVWEAAIALTGTEVTPELRAEQIKNIHELSDYQLRENVRSNSYYLK
jgi:hypothetical protein